MNCGCLHVNPTFQAPAVRCTLYMTTKSLLVFFYRNMPLQKKWSQKNSIQVVPKMGDLSRSMLAATNRCQKTSLLPEQTTQTSNWPHNYLIHLISLQKHELIELRNFFGLMLCHPPLVFHSNSFAGWWGDWCFVQEKHTEPCLHSFLPNR